MNALHLELVPIGSDVPTFECRVLGQPYAIITAEEVVGDAGANDVAVRTGWRDNHRILKTLPTSPRVAALLVLERLIAMTAPGGVTIVGA